VRRTASPKPAAPDPACPASGSTRLEFQIRFSRVPGKGRRPIRLRGATSAVEQTLPLDEQEPGVRPGTKGSAPSRLNPTQVPRITRLLVLGHHFERLVQEGVVKDYAEIAKLTGLSRARITQITSMTLLAPEIQGSMLLYHTSKPPLMHRSTLQERHVRASLHGQCWAIQRHEWLKWAKNQPKW
jgi:hypothetical protein